MVRTRRCIVQNAIARLRRTDAPGKRSNHRGDRPRHNFGWLPSPMASAVATRTVINTVRIEESSG